MKLRIFIFLPLFAISLAYGQQIETYHKWDYVPEEGKVQNDVENNAKSSACSNTSEGTIGLVDCNDVGTAAFATAGLTDAFDNENPPNAAQPAPPCGPGGNALDNGSWHVYDLEAGVDQVMVDYAGGFAGAGGFAELWMSFYQGPDCSSLTNVGCGQIIDKSGPSLILLDISVSGLDDSQQLWVWTWGNKDYDIDFTLTGLGTAPVNESCASATSAPDGCNLGAAGAAFTTPSTALGAGACNGGTWYSNENTVFYTFTATATSGTIDIDNLICNDGNAGEAQVGVWTDCASVGTYGANYLGCAVGSGTLTLPTLTIGNSYIIAVDGQAGDACTWDFTTTGITLPVELYSSMAYMHYKENIIEWTTASEINNDYFIIERLVKDNNWEQIDLVYANGTTNSLSSYKTIDKSYREIVNYYKLSQVDIDGHKEELKIFSIDNSIDRSNLLKIVDFTGAEVKENHPGPKIFIYKDGTTEKRY